MTGEEILTAIASHIQEARFFTEDELRSLAVGVRAVRRLVTWLDNYDAPVGLKCQLEDLEDAVVTLEPWADIAAARWDKIAAERQHDINTQVAQQAAAQRQAMQQNARQQAQQFFLG